jgi:hypothetical protein
MNNNSSRSCSCGGVNPNCFRCDGSGFITIENASFPSKFFNRGLVKAGDLSPEAILQKQVIERKKAKALSIREAQLKEERESIRRIEEARRIAALSTQKNSPMPSATLSSLPSTPAYRCVKCSYKWNRDPKARCAWCNEMGPYQLHQGKLGG